MLPLALVACLLAMAMAGRELRLLAAGQRDATQTYEDIYYLPPPAWLPAFSLGHREALADLIWMRALVYFGEEFRERGEVRHVFDYGEAMLSLDPDFRRVYRWIGMAGIYRPNAVSEADTRRAMSFLERGVARFPDDGELAWDLGAAQMYELAPRLAPSPEKDALKLQATEHMMTAARLGAGPAWLVLSNATQLQRLGEMEQAARHLEEMYSSVRDRDMRAQIATQIAAIRGRSEAEAFERANRQLDEAHRREYPYLPLGLYVLVRDPRPPRDLSSAPSTPPATP
jgi:hypothetical protein